MPIFTEKELPHGDDDIMPWGKYKGDNLSEVPDDYWRWFVGQEWAHEWPGLFDYARERVE